MSSGDELRRRGSAVLQRLDCVTNIKDSIRSEDEMVLSAKTLANWRERSQKELPNSEIIRSSKKLLRETSAALSMVSTVEDKDELEKHDFSTSSLSTVEKVNCIKGEPTLPVKKLVRRSESICKSLEQEHVYAIQQRNGRLHSARITVKDKKTYLHYLKKEDPPMHAHTVKHSDLIGMLNPDNTEVFMDISWNGCVRGRIHIHLSPDTPLARHFRLLCSGDLGPSYANTRFLEVKNKGDSKWEQIYGGDYQHNNGNGGAALIRGLKPMDPMYKRKSSTGNVWAKFHETDGLKIAQFGVKTGNTTGNIGDAMFGQVVDGLEILKATAKLGNIMEARIEDCGVVLPL